MSAIEFFVPGIPQPGGSKKGFLNRRTGRVVVLEDAKRNKEWRACVVLAAHQAHSGEPYGGPVRLDITFHMPRPKGHFGAGKSAGKLRPSAPRFHTIRPDRTKLLRSTEDALTDAGIWRDDTQVVAGEIRKVYASRPGAWIRITPITPATEEHADRDQD